MIRERCLLRILLCAVFGIVVPHLGAAEITGKVMAVSGETLTARVEGELTPNAGDEAEIFFKLAGTDEDISVATARVEKVTGDEVQLKIDNTTGEVEKDQLVRIKSEKPQKKTAAAAANPPSSAGTSPGAVPAKEFSLVGRWFGDKTSDGEETRVVFKGDGTVVMNPGGISGKYTIDSTDSPVSFAIHDFRIVPPADVTDEEMREFEEHKEELMAKFRDTVFLGEFDGPLRIRIEAFPKSETTPRPKLGPKARLFSRAAQGTSATDVAASSPSTPAVTQSGADGRNPSFVFVDMNQVFKDFPKTKTAEATINSARVTAKAEYDDRRARNLPSAETEAWRTQRETELQEQAVKMRTDLVAEITAAVKKVAPADANIVWDRSGFSTNRIPVALFTPPDSMSARVSSALAGRDGGPSSGLRGLQVGLVDMNQIFRNYTKTQKAEAKINTAKNAAKQEYDKRAEGYQKEMAKIDTLSGAARDKQIAKVRTLEQQVNGWRVTKEQELQAEAVKMRDGIVKEVSDAITARLTGKSSSLVLDKSGNGTNGVPAVLWSSGVADFTSEITEALNTGRKSGPAVPLTSLSTLKVASIDIERAFRSMPEGSAAGAKGLPGLDATTREPLVARLSAKVSEVAQSAGYNLVIDSSALSSNALPFVVQTSNLPDLTDELIARVK